MTISPGDATLYRTHPQVYNSYLWVDNPPIIYQGQINEPSGVTYPLRFIQYDNASGSASDVEGDMLITFGTAPGGDDLGRTRVLAITDVQIAIPRASQGTVDGTVNIINDTYFTIYDHFPIAPKLPYFDAPTQTFMKDGDRVFVAALPPIANIGYAHIYADFVDGSDVLTLTIDSSDSFSPIGGTLTRLWDVKDGNITVGNTTSTAITVEFPVGRRWISLLIQDTTNSRATIRRLLVVACKYGTAYAPIVEVIPGTLTQTVEGLRQSFRFGQDIPADTYLDCVPVCYFQHSFYGSTEDNLNDTSVVKFAGWHHIDPARLAAQSTYLQRETTLDCLDTAGKMATFPGFPQSIESNAAPTRWEEMASPNLDKFLVYLWLYHSTAPNLSDFDWSGTTTTYPFFRLNSQGNSLYGQIDGRARAIGYRLLADAKGKCKVTKDSMLFAQADRDNTEIISLTESDYKAIGWTKQRPSRSHWNRGNAVVASASAYNAVFCIAPGSVPSWGLGANELGENLAVDQAELNTRVGNAYQRENSLYSYFEIELINPGDIGYEPLKFIEITLGADYAAQRGLTLTTQRMMIVAIPTDYDPAFGTQRRRLILELETFGTDAETVIPPPDPLPELTPVIDIYPTNLSTGCDGGLMLDQCTGTIALIRQDGNLSRTSNWHTPSGSGGPNWATVSMGVSGTVFTYAVDPYSPRYIAGSGAVNLWVGTSTGIYYVEDVFDAISATLQYTLAATAQAIVLDASIVQQGWLTASIDYGSTGGHSGIWTTFTTDGENWSAEAQITAHYGSAFAAAVCVCSQVTPGLCYTEAYTSTTPAVARLYRSTDYGATWSLVASPSGFTPGSNVMGGLHLRYQNENIIYLSGFNSPEFIYRDNGDGTYTDVTPGGSYAGFTARSISSSPQNGLKVVAAAANIGGSPLFTTFTSEDGGDSWTVINTVAHYGFAAIAGDNSNIIYLTGETGEVGYSSDFGATIDNRKGDLSYGGYIVGLVGG